MLGRFFGQNRSISIECPDCKYNFKVPDKYFKIGKVVHCANCGNIVNKSNMVSPNHLSEEEQKFIEVIKQHASNRNRIMST